MGSVGYVRRNPEHSLLYKIVQTQFETFLAQASEAHDTAGVPKFVEKELRAFLDCGVLARGFARWRCADCSSELLVALSCKGRGFCASCGGKRMTGLAAHLTDHVIPFVPVRQFVLSVPHRLRYLLAYDHERCIAVLRIFIRALMSFYRSRARKRGVARARTGTVTFLQRFGSAANLHLHAHVIVLDGVFTEAANGHLSFHPAQPPSEVELADLLARVRTRILSHFKRRGLLDADHDLFGEQAPVLANCYAASIGGRQTVGRRAGAKLQRIGADPHAPWVEAGGRLRAQCDGFDLHAALTVQAQRADGRQPLEKLLRYCARPPIAEERLKELPDGRIALRLKTPWHDGTTHVVFEPLDFVAKLAALVPRPRKNLVLYHGVLSANAAWRSRVVSYGREANPFAPQAEAPPAREDEHCVQRSGSARVLSRTKRRQWAELMRRAFGYDMAACTHCGGRMRLRAIVLDQTATRKILLHLHLPSAPPTTSPARASP